MRDHINAFVKHQTSMIVQSGPFAGMRLNEETSWGDGDVTPKLLGTYEQELHPFLVHMAKRHYGAIVDIGCAEGYYAVGAARMFPDCKVFAYDADPRALHVLRKNARLNEVEGSVEPGGACGPETLIRLAGENGPLLVICDCEGYEVELFSNPELQRALRHSDLVIECHDFLNPASTAVCLGMFARTHTVESVHSGGRNPNAFPFLAHFNDIERWLAVCENRPCLMNWLICRSRQLRA